MGLLLSIVSRFRKKTTTKEVLEQLEEDIERYESTLQRNRQLQKSTVLFLLTTSVALYLLAALVFYMWYMPRKWSERLLYLLPFFGFPFLVVLLKKTLRFVFVTRISKNARLLEVKRKEKKKILENMMETETYKVAKELLQKFDPKRKLVERETPTKTTPPESSPNNGTNRTPGQEIRHRNVQGSQQHPQQMIRPMLQNRPQVMPAMSNTPSIIHGPGMRSPVPMQLRFQTPNQSGTSPLPNAPILPRDRSFFDKVAEYFVGDGPNNRYALICANCFSHNGMALMEDFEYTAFKCCYCGHFNPARKERPNAPKLESDVLSSATKSPVLRTSANQSISDNDDKSEDPDAEPSSVQEKDDEHSTDVHELKEDEEDPTNT